MTSRTSQASTRAFKPQKLARSYIVRCRCRFFIYIIWRQSLRTLTLCFHFMHWTNSSCIKWASRPLCFIFFGSSFWYLQASERKERKVLINWYDNRAMRWAKHHRTRPVSLIKVEGIEVTRIQTQKVEHTYSHRQPYWLTQTDRQKYIRKRTRRVSEQERRK